MGTKFLPPDIKTTNQNKLGGHRSRLRERFFSGGLAGFHDYELLEAILFLAYPRADVKPIAKEMLNEMKSLAGVIGGDKRHLLKVRGIGEMSVFVLKVIQEIFRRTLLENLKKMPLLDTQSKVLDYCKICMAYEDIEHFRILFLNKKNFLIFDEVVQHGTIDSATIYPREVLKRALDLEAGALIMVHNHPSGDPTPSLSDITMTKKVKDALLQLDIDLHDHIVIAKHGYVSFRTEGII